MVTTDTTTPKVMEILHTVGAGTSLTTITAAEETVLAVVTARLTADRHTVRRMGNRMGILRVAIRA